MSGRLAARAMENSAVVKRKLDYGGDNNNKRTPKATVNGSILKHKRTVSGILVVHYIIFDIMNSQSGGSSVK